MYFMTFKFYKNIMVAQNKNVETLQTEVNQVAADLVEAKKQTDEMLKKTKAEAAALKTETTLDEVKTAKEDANKKLKALEGKTDAISKAEVIKLQSEIDTYEEMLKALDSSKTELATLKAGVTTPEVAKTSIDNTVDMTNITTGIAEMKIMVTELQTLIDEYNKIKSTLTETEKTTKEKNIADKKAVIENKRKEIQTIIDKIKKVWTDFKFDDIPDETMKTALKTQKETELKNLDDYKKQLNALVIPTLTFWEKITNVANKTWERAKENPWKTWGIVVWAWLLIGWMAGWFKKKKKSEGDDKDKDGKTTEKKSFWGKAWNVIKVVGIWGWIYYVIHGLVSGRRWMTDMFNWDKRNETNPEDIKSRYEKNVDVALKPKYEKFWGTVDEFRKWIWNTDSLWTLQNEKHEEITIPKWAIPAMLDSAYGNVWEILSNDYITDKWKNTGGQLRDMVKGLWEKAIGYLIKPMVWAIKWLTNKMFGSDWKPNEEFQKWAQTPDATRDEQIGNLMTKYAMVRRYLSDKKDQLARKYAIQELAHKNITNPTEQDIQDSLDKNKDTIKERIEADFSNKKIATLKSGDSIVDTLEWENIYNHSPSETTLAVTTEVHKRKDEIVTDKTIWERAKNSPDINKDDVLLTELNGVSDRFWAYLKKWLLHRNILEKMANCRWILNLDELWNGKAEDLEEVMETIHMDTMVKESKKANFEFMEKINKKTLTKEDISNFEKAMNDYFNKENEILQDLETKNKEDGDKSFWETSGIWIERRFYKLTHTFTWYVIMGTWFLYARYAWVRTVVNRIVSVPLSALKGITVNPIIRNVNVNNGLGINKRLKMRVYTESKYWFTKFSNDFKAGKIPWKEAHDVFEYRKWAWKRTELFNDRIAGELNVTKNQAMLIREYFDSDNIRKIVKNTKNMNFWDLAVKLNTYDTKITSLSWDTKTFCKNLFESSQFKSMDDIDLITKNIDAIDIKGLTPKQINQLAKDLGKDVSILSDPAKVASKIDEVKKAVAGGDVVVNTIPTQATSDIFKLADAAEAKTKIAYKVSEAHPNSKTADIVKKFDDGTYKDYPCTAENWSVSTFKAEYAKLDGNQAELQKLDYKYAETLWKEQDPTAKVILEETKTIQLADFTTKMESRITELNTKKGLFTNNDAPERLAKANIEKQVTSLKNIESTAATMTEDQLKWFESLYKNIKSVPGCMEDVVKTWDTAAKDADLMKALTEWNIAELEKFKVKVPEVENVIKLFDKEGANVEKILAGWGKFDEVLESLLKAFMRLR